MVREYDAIKMASANIMPMDWFMWGSDFPHSVCTYPNSDKYIEELFGTVSEESRRKLLLTNVADFYHLDLNTNITETPS
jgi:predicted TIM-barrel fold metal-dependent hydrolase